MSGIIGTGGSSSGVVGKTQISEISGFYLVTPRGSSGGTPAMHSGSDTFSYVRIGSWCHIHGTIQVTSTSGCSGTMQFKMPFLQADSVDGSGYHAVSVPTYAVDWPGNFLALQGAGGSDWVSLYGINDGGATSNVMTTGYFRINFGFRTANNVLLT